ncbi:MAG: TatD family hydrolase [Candidatus Paceibacterota bacterium]
MPIIDTHCHYNMEPFFSGKKFIFDLEDGDSLLNMNWQDHWQNAQAKGVTGSVVVGTTIETSDLALEIAQKEPNLLAAVGVHPSHAHEITLDQLDRAAANWTEQKIHAVGETGLDFFRLDPNDEAFEQITNQQKEVFRWHIRFAQQQNLPLIVHVRDKTELAYRETLAIIKKEYSGDKPFVLHCISGPLDYVQEAIEFGAFIGFDANITYPKAQEIRDLVGKTPANRLLIETDAPFLPPQNHRGKVCEPWMIAETAEYAQQELGLNLDQLFENSQNFFEHSFVK